MAAYIGFQPSDFFNTKLYSAGTAPLAITGVGFQPDLTWIKSRTYADNHNVFDSVRGATDILYPNDTWVEDTQAESLKSWQSDGFTVGTRNDTNRSGKTFASWNWKAGTTSGLSGGTITPTSYSINTTSGFGIYAYGGNGTAGATFSHGLGTTPEFIMVKTLNYAYNWSIQTPTTGNGSRMKLNTNAAKQVGADYWNNTSPTSTLITFGANAEINSSSYNYIMYAFTPIKGYSRFGNYIGNGNIDGPFIYTGFRPAFVMSKAYSTTGQWMMNDNKRPLYHNGSGAVVYADSTGVETQNTGWTMVDFLSNGFKPRYNDGLNNASGVGYIYMAFAEFPCVSSNSIPTVAR